MCRHSCRPIGSRPARRHAVRARFRTAVGVNGSGWARAEDETRVAADDELVFDEEIAERGDDRNAAPTGATLRLAGLAVAVHAALDADDPAREVDVLPEERPELAAAQACIERTAPQGAILEPDGGDECRGLGRRSDPLASTACGWEAEPLARVDGDVAVLDRASEDDLERLERVPDRARVGSRGEQLVCELLEVAPLNLRELGAAEGGEDVESERALVLADNGGLVPFTRPRADRAARHAVDERLCGLAERLRRAAESNALRRLRLSRRTPAAGLSERPECLRDLALADRVVRCPAVARLAVAAPAGT